MLGKRGDLGVPYYLRNIGVDGFSPGQMAGLLVCDGVHQGCPCRGSGLVHHLSLQLSDTLADDSVDSADQGRHFL